MKTRTQLHKKQTIVPTEVIALYTLKKRQAQVNNSSQQTTSRQRRDIQIAQPTELEGTLKTTVLCQGCVKLNALTIASVVTELQTGHLVIL